MPIFIGKLRMKEKDRKRAKENRGLCYNKFNLQFTSSHFNVLVMHMSDKIT